MLLYREVLGLYLGDLSGAVRARTAPRLPVVLTRDEVRALLVQPRGVELGLCLLEGERAEGGIAVVPPAA